MTELPEAGWPGKAYTGERITVYFDANRCRHFAECVRGLPHVFDTSQRPWISPEGAPADQVADVIRRCPSGALHYTGTAVGEETPDVPTTVTVVPGGPFLARGDLRIVLGNETIAETRAALCACGRSGRQPFCDAACTGPPDL